jgi:hypothetical protein
MFLLLVLCMWMLQLCKVGSIKASEGSLFGVSQARAIALTPSNELQRGSFELSLHAEGQFAQNCSQLPGLPPPEIGQTPEFKERFKAAFEHFCTEKTAGTDLSQSANLQRSIRSFGNKCVYTDLHFAAAQEVVDGFENYPPAQPDDRILFDHSMAVLTSASQIMGWGPTMDYFTKQITDVSFDSSAHSSHPTHAEYYEPFLSGKWRKDRATIVFTPAKPCVFIKAQQGAMWVEDSHTENGAANRAAAVLKGRGVEVEIDKTRSPPLDHPYVVIGEMGDNWGWLSSYIPGRCVLVKRIPWCTNSTTVLAYS